MSQSLKEDHGHDWFHAQVFWFRQWQLKLISVKTFELGLITPPTELYWHFEAFELYGLFPI